MNNVYFRIRDIICFLCGDFVFYVVILFVMLSIKFMSLGVLLSVLGMFILNIFWFIIILKILYYI